MANQFAICEPQVAVNDYVHVARLDVMVQDVMVDVKQAHTDRLEPVLEVQLSVITRRQEKERLPLDKYIHPEMDTPCMTMINAAMSWFGSICLSACIPDSNKATLQCSIPFPEDGMSINIALPVTQ